MLAPSRRLLVGALFSLGLVFLLAGQQPRAGEPRKGEKAGTDLPSVFAKEQPESVDDLKTIEVHVQGLLGKITPAVVGVRLGAAQGSGVIVSKDGFVLTAGHVSGEPGRDAIIVLPDGKQLKAKTLGKNGGIDSGMIKISGEGEYPFVEMGKSEDLKKGTWVMAIGHPGGFRPNRTPVLRVGRVLSTSPFLIRTDCTLVGGDSGGPLFDMNGRVIGIHSRIGGSISENIHVPIKTYRETWDKLAKGESWGGTLGQPALVHTPGGKIIVERDGKLIKEDAHDSKKPGCHFHLHTVKMVPGFAFTIDMIRVDPKKADKKKKDDATELDPFLRIEDSSGKPLAEDDDGGGNLNARVVFWPEKADDYRIIATTFEPNQTGAYKLFVRQAEPKLLAGKVEVLPALRIPRTAAPTFIDAVQKTGNVLFASGTVVDGKGKPVSGKTVQFRWDKGGLAKMKSDDHGVVFLQLNKQNARNLTLEVPDGLRIALALTDASGNPRGDPDQEKETVKSAGGKLILEEHGQLTDQGPKDKIRDDMVKRKVTTACVFKAYSLKLVPGSTYTIDLESIDFDAYLRLEDPSGKQVAEDDDSGGNLNSRIVYTPQSEGEYRIIVTTCDPGQSGTYRLAVLQNEAKKASTDPKTGDQP